MTIFCSDIESSTALNSRLGDARWMELLHEHNAIIRREIANRSGFEVKTEGDGFMIAFGSSRSRAQSLHRRTHPPPLPGVALAVRRDLAGGVVRVHIGQEHLDLAGELFAQRGAKFYLDQVSRGSLAGRRSCCCPS